VVSDDEYEAHLALYSWCQNKADEGVDDFEKLSLSEELEYHQLTFACDIHATHHDVRIKKMLAERMSWIIEIMQEKIIEDHCS
jgi:hypothetical protein